MQSIDSVETNAYGTNKEVIHTQKKLIKGINTI